MGLGPTGRGLWLGFCGNWLVGSRELLRYVKPGYSGFDLNRLISTSSYICSLLPPRDFPAKSRTEPSKSERRLLLLVLLLLGSLYIILFCARWLGGYGPLPDFQAVGASMCKMKCVFPSK